MDKSDRVDDRVRMRLSIRPTLDKRLEVASDVLDVDRNALATLCFSLGLRMLEISVINPMSTGIQVAMDQTASDALSSAVVDADVELPRSKKE